jgi:hypothetical protein
MLVYPWVAIFSLGLLRLKSLYAYTPDITPSLLICNLTAHCLLILAFSSVGANDVTSGTFMEAAVFTIIIASGVPYNVMAYSQCPPGCQSRDSLHLFAQVINVSIASLGLLAAPG